MSLLCCPEGWQTCSDETPKKPGCERDLNLAISSNMKTHWKQVSSFPDLECCPSSSQCQDIKALRMNTLNWTYRRSDCSFLTSAVNLENRCICSVLGSFRCTLKCSRTLDNEFARNTVIFWAKLSRMGLYLKTKSAALSILVYGFKVTFQSNII